jgi:hypothetical protein
VVETLSLCYSHHEPLERAEFRVELGEEQSDGVFRFRYGRDQNGAERVLKVVGEGDPSPLLGREVAMDKELRHIERRFLPRFARLVGWDAPELPSRVLIDIRGRPLLDSDDLPLAGDDLKRAAQGLFEALTVLTRLGYAHGDISSRTVFWDEVRIQLTGFCEARPSGKTSREALDDVGAAAELVYQVATGGLSQSAERMLADLTARDEAIGKALAPAFSDIPANRRPAEEILARLSGTQVLQPPSVLHTPPDRPVAKVTQPDHPNGQAGAFPPHPPHIGGLPGRSGPSPAGSPSLEGTPEVVLNGAAATPSAGAVDGTPQGGGRWVDPDLDDEKLHIEEFHELRREQRDFRQGLLQGTRPPSIPTAPPPQPAPRPQPPPQPPPAPRPQPPPSNPHPRPPMYQPPQPGNVPPFAPDPSQVQQPRWRDRLRRFFGPRS